MRSFRRLAARWPISVLCMVALIGPIVGVALAPLPVLAQTIGTIEVAVVDFRNLSKVPNDIFGAMATDALVVELLRSGKFGVTTADDLQAKMEQLGYKSEDDRAPKVVMTPSMMVRLGQEVGADSVVSGEVTSIKVNGDRKEAEVRIVVRMLHVASGEWANGAIATGKSYPRIGYTADKETDLIIEAINDAARKAVETMVQYIIPEATIIGTFGANEVLLNRGAQEGLQPGMEMIVLRRGETGEDDVVGRIRLTKVSDTDARGAVIHSTRGMKPEDRVRAVFELPTDTAKAAAPRIDAKKRASKGAKLLWGLVALIGLATLFKGGGDKGEEVPAAVAMAGKAPDITSHWDEGGILVAWNTPKNLRHADIVEFHVWRDTKGQVGPVGGTGDVGPVTVNDMYTATPYSTPAGTFDHGVVDDITGVEFTYRYANVDHDLADGDMTAPGITVGKTHQYWLTCVYARRTSDPGGQEVVTYWETDPVYAGRATYISRPVLEAPGGIVATDYVDLSNVTFEWRGSGGADQYVIEVSTTPDFARDQTWVDVVYQPTPAEGQLFTKTYTDVLKDSATGQVVLELAGVPPGGTLYWRVGARNRLDQPGPYPAGPSPQVSGPKSTRYIYTDQTQIYMFMTLPDLPGPPPDEGDDGGEPPTPPPPPPL